MKYLVQERRWNRSRFTIEKVGIDRYLWSGRLAVAKEIEKRIRPGERIWCICGTGNNGADGIAAARILYLKGYFVKLVCCGLEEKGTEEYHSQLAIARHVGVPEYRWDQVKEQIDGVVADGIFGVGLSRPVEGIYGEILDCLEEKRKCGNIGPTGN
ncbi:MAG: NAD(P)H-hydrate epimerase [Hungatella sp.]